MKIGTRSLLFGVHQFVLHPLFVLIAWLIVYQSRPKFYELCAIITHDWGYWGSPDMDGRIGEAHPDRAFKWWRNRFGSFGGKVGAEILGHSGYYADRINIPVSRLYYADKLAAALYPKLLYLLLANLSGEIREYTRLCGRDSKYGHSKKVGGQWRWLLETQSQMALTGLSMPDTYKEPESLAN